LNSYSISTIEIHWEEVKVFYALGIICNHNPCIISALVCVIIFPKFIVINAFAILILSDASAAVFGRKFGKHKFFKKSLEGTIAFILASIPVVLLAPKVQNLPGEYVITMISAIVGGIIEAASINLKVDDNLLIPASIGATMWILYSIFYPNLDLYFLK